MADSPQLQWQAGQRAQDGRVERLNQLEQVQLVTLELFRIGETSRVNLEVLVITLHELDDERSDHRLEVVKAKCLEGEGEDLASDGVTTEEGVHTTTL